MYWSIAKRYVKIFHSASSKLRLDKPVYLTCPSTGEERVVTFIAAEKEMGGGGDSAADDQCMRHKGQYKIKINNQVDHSRSSSRSNNGEKTEDDDPNLVVQQQQRRPEEEEEEEKGGGGFFITSSSSQHFQRRSFEDSGESDAPDDDDDDGGGRESQQQWRVDLVSDAARASIWTVEIDDVNRSRARTFLHDALQRRFGGAKQKRNNNRRSSDVSASSSTTRLSTQSTQPPRWRTIITNAINNGQEDHPYQREDLEARVGIECSCICRSFYNNKMSHYHLV